MSYSPAGHKFQTAEYCKEIAYVDPEGVPQKTTRNHWVVWTCQVNTLQHRVEMGMTACYHTEDGCHPNLTDADEQMAHMTLTDQVDGSHHRNFWVELLATVDGNPFAISPQVVLDYVADAGILPTIPGDAA